MAALNSVSYTHLDVYKRQVYGRTADIAVSDFGKKIYYSKEAIDVPRPMAESIKEIIMGSSFIAPLKNAMNELLTPKTKKNGNDYNQ